MSDKQIVWLASIVAVAGVAVALPLALRPGRSGTTSGTSVQPPVPASKPSPESGSPAAPSPTPRATPLAIASPAEPPAAQPAAGTPEASNPRDVLAAFEAAKEAAVVRTAGSSPGFVIVTEGTLGFKEGSRFYGFGARAEDFIKAFGRPDEGGPYGFIHYYHDGFTLNLDDERRVNRFIFYTAPGAQSGRMRVAPVVTDKGIGPGATADQVIRAHGTPLADQQGPGNTHGLFYKNIDFVFIGGELHRTVVWPIEIVAK